MAGSTESNKRMGDMVSTVSAHGCPKGYTGTPPNCKKISTDIDGNTLDIDFDKVLKKKKTNITTHELPTTWPYDPSKPENPKTLPFRPGRDDHFELQKFSKGK